MLHLERERKKKQRLIREGKKVQQSEPENIELVLKIFRGWVTDERTPTQPYEGPEYYRVMAWTDVEKQYGTKAVKGFRGIPIFNIKLVIPLDSPAHQYLYIELHKGISWRDPGTSNGTIVMGRAKIPLPPWNSRGEFTSKFNLVRLNSDRCVEIKGFLELSMQLHRYVAL